MPGTRVFTNTTTYSARSAISVCCGLVRGPHYIKCGRDQRPRVHMPFRTNAWTVTSPKGKTVDVKVQPCSSRPPRISSVANTACSRYSNTVYWIYCPDHINKRTRVSYLDSFCWGPRGDNGGNIGSHAATCPTTKKSRNVGPLCMNTKPSSLCYPAPGISRHVCQTLFVPRIQERAAAVTDTESDFMPSDWVLYRLRQYQATPYNTTRYNVKQS